jgi:uncharacterized protein
VTTVKGMRYAVLSLSLTFTCHVMPRFILVLSLLLAGLPKLASAAPPEGLPTRPVPFTFVTDKGNLLQAGEAKKLDSGLRRYAASTGTQVVVVTVPSLGGTDVAEYGRQLGTAWGVGQRGKNNGVVVLLAAKEHQVAIEAGSGLKETITPALTTRVINQEMTPAFKQGNYFGGLRKGLSTLMLAANPSSNPDKNKPAAAAATSGATATETGTSLADQTPSTSAADPAGVQESQVSAPSSGFGIGTLLIGAVVIIGGIWLLKRLFSRGNNAAGTASQAPNFMGNRPPNGPTPNFGVPNTGYPQQPGYGNAPASGGSGIGGMLATGAAAAAGAYIGNRMSSGHEESGNAARNFNDGGGSVGAAPAAGAADDYFSSRGGNTDANSSPDYFSDDATSDNSGDYFSDDSSYDDTSSDDTGGGGFDGDGSKGSW